MVIKRTSVHSGVVLESVPLLMCSLSPLRKLPFVLRDQYVTKTCLLINVTRCFSQRRDQSFWVKFGFLQSFFALDRSC